MDNLNDLLLTAANLLLVGMTVVFLFLGLLIICIKAMSKFFGGEVEQPVVRRPANRAPKTNSDARNAQVTAAITAAIHQHRQNK
jgi:oxaloacetate decarboxylase gamma subunit